MDLITHVLIAYLVTLGLVGFHVQYLAAGALAGGLPDADALLFPLARRWPILSHRGITHSFLGITVIALGGALIAPLILPGSVLIYFAVFLLGGALHILLDGFTNYSVPPLLPFSRRRVAFDAERAVNFFVLIFSVVSMYVLLGVERNVVALDIYWASVYFLGAFFALYLGLRLGARLWLGRNARAYGAFDYIVPTENPFVWFLFGESREGDRLHRSLGRYVVGRGLQGPYTLDLPVAAPTPGSSAPIESAAAALERSYPLLAREPAGRFGRMAEETHMFARADRTAEGGWIARWYSIEFGMLGRWMTIEVSFPPGDVPPKIDRAFRRIVMPWSDPASSGPQRATAP